MKNQQIINYKITTEIGKGGMATVYKAKHINLDTEVAIKVLDPVLGTNDNIRQRFKQEAKIMASLQHDNITKVIDFEDTDNRLAIIMEYLDGETLNDYIKQKGALAPTEAKKIFAGILNACSYAHKKNIVHRDIKPSNIFITNKGEIKIMDFGIAKIIEDGANVLTQTGTQMGTPVYMSPEQVNDSKRIDHLSDIYSLGVCLWFMLSGKPPYDAKTASTFAIYKKIDSEPLANLPNTEMNAILQKATAKDKNKRFANCDEFSKAFGSENENTIIDSPIPTQKPEPKPKSDIPNGTNNKVTKEMITHFLSVGESFFPKELLGLMERDMKSISYEKFKKIKYFDYQNPKTMLFIAIFGGTLGIDRFILGPWWQGILKIIGVIVTFGIFWIIDCFTVINRTRKFNYDKFLEIKNN